MHVKLSSTCFFLIIGLCSSAERQSYSVFDGNCSEDGELLYEEYIQKDGSLFTVTEAWKTFKKDTHTISCIEIINNWEDGTGGTASITQGGFGESFAEIHLKSQLHRGFSFTIKILGHPKNHHVVYLNLNHTET